MTIKNPEFHDCECGFRWAHGKSGDHNCGQYYRETIRELRAAAEPQVVADELPLLPGPHGVIAVYADDAEGNQTHEVDGYTASQMRGYAVDYGMQLARAALAAATVQAQEPVAEVSAMPGTSGFTMAVFKADDMPIGSKVFRATVQPVAVPDGWKLVPIRPTTEMLSVIAGTDYLCLSDSKQKSECKAYDKLLAVAPAAPAAQGEVKDAELIANKIADELQISGNDSDMRTMNRRELVAIIIAAIAAKAAS